MTLQEIIDGLQMTIDLCLYNPNTGETITEPRNDMDKTTVDACKGAIELLKQEPCEDAISKQSVLELVADYDLSMGKVVKGIHALSPVTPQPKVGRWIYHDGYIPYKNECSECGKRFGSDFNYCPNCGAKMQEGDAE